MHVVSSTMKVHRTTPARRLAGGGTKGPPSAPPTIPPIIINPFNREAPKERIIDPFRTPPPPPVRRPSLPGMRI
ncbi:hypothetical protein [Massilia sp. Leaf139]|uniref:hypothetical protein n=1 Tax=Massilia sp. Leaf139 TaxID=1736272 RepID=UPI000A488A18|nr:hypothetical protein [Massilia sp. Leaf139]